MTKAPLKNTVSKIAVHAGTPLEGLTPLQLSYSFGRVENPSLSHTEVARLYGCKSMSEKGLTVRASVLEKRTEKARAYLTEKTIRNPGNGALGIGIIRHLAEHGSPDSVRLAAAAKLVELAGYAAVRVSEIHHRVEATLTTPQLKARIAQLLGEISVDDRAALAKQGLLPSADVIDVTPEPVAEWEGELIRSLKEDDNA